DISADAPADCTTRSLAAYTTESRAHGRGTPTRTASLVGSGARGPVDTRLRYAHEPARHKILDLLGDLSWLNHDLHGHLVAYRSGHQLNIELVRALTRRLGKAACPCKVEKLAA